MIGFIEHVHQITGCLVFFLSLIFLCIRTTFAGFAYYGIFLLVLQFLVITLNAPVHHNLLGFSSCLHICCRMSLISNHLFATF